MTSQELEIAAQAAEAYPPFRAGHLETDGLPSPVRAVAIHRKAVLKDELRIIFELHDLFGGYRSYWDDLNSDPKLVAARLREFAAKQKELSNA